MEAAATLVEARELSEHGEWMPWLEKTGIPERTAQRMMQLARAGIKSDTLTVLGASRIIELLAGNAQKVIGKVWAEGDPPITGDEAVRMANFGESAKEIWKEFWDVACEEGDPEFKDRMIRAIPDGYPSARTWVNWYIELCETEANSEEDPDAYIEVLKRAQWHLACLCPDLPDPEPVAA